MRHWILYSKLLVKLLSENLQQTSKYFMWKMNKSRNLSQIFLEKKFYSKSIYSHLFIWGLMYCGTYAFGRIILNLVTLCFEQNGNIKGVTGTNCMTYWLFHICGGKWSILETIICYVSESIHILWDLLT